MRTICLAMVCIATLAVGHVHAGHNAGAKVAVHVLPHDNRTCADEFPVISYCGDIITTYEGCGDVDFFPVFFGLVEFTGAEYGMIWAGSGSCLFTSCSDLTIGEINWSGDGISHTWFDCHVGSEIIPGWGWISCGEPGAICVVEHPGSQALIVTDCQFLEDPAVMSFCAGVCGVPGMDPCQETPPYMPLAVDIEPSVGDECVFIGDDLTYTVGYGNPVNPGTVTEVVLICSYSPHTTFRSASSGGSPISGERVRWNLDQLAAGEMGTARFTVRVKEETPAETLLPVSALIACVEARDSTAKDTTLVCVEGFEPLALDIEPSVGSDCIFVGDDLTYTIDYGNPVNPGTVSGVVLTCSYSPHTIFINASQGGQEIYGDCVKWNLGHLSAGEMGTAQFTVRVKQVTPPGTLLPASARIVCNQAHDSTDTDTIVVCVEELAPLGLAKDDGVGEDEKVPVGDYIIYKIAYDNSANSTEVSNVRVVDDLASKAEFVSASDGGVYDPGFRAVTWEVGTLAAGASDSVELVTRVSYSVNEWEAIINSCSVKGDETRTTRVNERTEVQLAKVALHVRPHAHWHKCGVDMPNFTYCYDINEDSESCDVTVYPVLFDVGGLRGLEYSMVWPGDWGSMTFESCSDATVGNIVQPWDSVVQTWNECQQGHLFIPAVCHVTATGPGQIRVVEHRDSGIVGITTCRGNKYNATVRFPGGVCGEDVDPPCGYPTQTVPVTWGKIKSMFR